jgi:hypothetical protein
MLFCNSEQQTTMHMQTNFGIDKYSYAKCKHLVQALKLQPSALVKR